MDETQGTMQNWLEAFLLDRRVRQVSSGTIRFYSQKLRRFIDWCAKEDITTVNQLSPNHLRLFLVSLEDSGNNAGGRHAYYRSVRAFLTFFESETEPANWKNPIRKVSAPRVPERPIDPVSIEQVSSLIQVFNPNSFYGSRDKAILMFLLDTGVRASELLGIDLNDINLIDSSIQIRKGKGSKVRVVFIGKKAKKIVRLWLKKRSKNAIPLFTTKGSERLKYSGLRQILKRRSKETKVTDVSLHDFRRAFCLAQLQAGIPETTIARFMGHANTQLFAIYARQTTRDLKQVFYSIGDSEL